MHPGNAGLFEFLLCKTFKQGFPPQIVADPSKYFGGRATVTILCGDVFL